MRTIKSILTVAVTFAVVAGSTSAFASSDCKNRDNSGRWAHTLPESKNVAKMTTQKPATVKTGVN